MKRFKLYLLVLFCFFVLSACSKKNSALANADFDMACEVMSIQVQIVDRISSGQGFKGFLAENGDLYRKHRPFFDLIMVAKKEDRLRLMGDYLKQEAKSDEFKETYQTILMASPSQRGGLLLNAARESKQNPQWQCPSMEKVFLP